MAFRLGADETLTLSGRGLVIGREGVGLQFRTSPGKENTRKRPLFYFIIVAQLTPPGAANYLNYYLSNWYSMVAAGITCRPPKTHP